MQGRRRWQEAAEIASCIDPVWSGTIAYRALIPGDRLKATAPGHPVLTTPTQVFQVFLLEKIPANLKLLVPGEEWRW
jgi:hypothetical protein